MYQIDFNNRVNIYFCGIGGISMSGLAEILLDAGFNVSGSDRQQSELTDYLSKNGAGIFIGQCEENITKDVDVFVYTAAIHSDHPEYKKASSLGIPMLTRAELLGQMMRNYKLPIAISGTHGKTTVTSMISDILLKSEKDPTLLVGGMLETIGGNYRIGHSDYFVTEACEYTNSFLSFFPKASVILNIEEDHLDFFKDLDDIRSSFHRFAKLSPDNGVVIINGEIENVDEITKDIDSKVITFGSDSRSDYYPSGIHFDGNGISHFTLNSPNHEPEDFSLRVPGSHNIMNAVAAVALADFLCVDRRSTKKALSEFKGSKRRFEFRGQVNGFTVVDDYAHHPSEIKATLTATKDYPHKKVWCIFQPHTYTRTKAFLDEFVEALTLADATILTDIYAARETDTLGVSAKDISDKLTALGKESHYISDFSEIEKFVLKNCSQNDLLITMGAGNVVNIADNLVK